MCTDRNKTNLNHFTIWNNLKWVPTKTQLDQFVQLQDLLREWNKKLNLTRLIDGNDFWIAQVCDSLWPLSEELRCQTKHPQKFIDVGSGCGFPGLAIAIAIPNSNVTLLDSSTKKTTFLKEAAKEIGLTSRIKIVTERAESAGKNRIFRGEFDYAVARAVAPATVVAEYLIPFLSSNGQALIFKGGWTKQEQQTLKKALTQLNAEIRQTYKFTLPDNRGIRNIIRINSIGECPITYPRSIGKPRKNPLGY